MSRARQVANFDPALFAADEVSGDKVSGGTIGAGVVGASVTGGAGLSGMTSLGTVATGTWEGTDVAVAHGGTGASTHTANNVLIGAGAGAITSVAPGADGQVLTSTGTVWQSEAAGGGGVDMDGDSWWVALRADGEASGAIIGSDSTWGWSEVGGAGLRIGTNCSLASGVITVGTAGWYHVILNFGHRLQEDKDTEISLRVGGTSKATRIHALSTNDGIGHWSQTKSWFVDLSASDTLDFYGSAIWMGSSNQLIRTSSWLGYRIGA